MSRWLVVPAAESDAGEILTLQRACWVQEAMANDTLDIPALHESLDDVLASLGCWHTYVVRDAGRLIGSVRGRLVDGECEIGRLMVAPDRQGLGLGRLLLEQVVRTAPPGVPFVLSTGALSLDNQRMYRAAGFEISGPQGDDPGVVRMRRKAIAGPRAGLKEREGQTTPSASIASAT
jgi:tRNA (guanine37-N1)-methyltransferase